mmetsp:Transcript_41573/g.99653  ORF Transcript_41573/g.99653 Transcript_41573/m.99653 type:complete len:106 (-) Transcript_41573:258-575(-)
MILKMDCLDLSRDGQFSIWIVKAATLRCVGPTVWVPSLKLNVHVASAVRTMLMMLQVRSTATVAVLTSIDIGDRDCVETHHGSGQRIYFCSRSSRFWIQQSVAPE